MIATDRLLHSSELLEMDDLHSEMVIGLHVLYIESVFYIHSTEFYSKFT